MLAQLGEVQVERLTTLQDSFDDIRCEERTCENLSHVTFCEPGMPGQRSLIESLSLKNPFVPTMRSGDGFNQ
jgi:hypothetical protein